MKPSLRPYIECPECTSCDVDRIEIGTRSGLRSRDVCNRCGHVAAEFKRQAFDPNRFDSRPRLAGMILPTCREDLDA
ncbi:hypothetical protein [Methylobacterium gnaphalii]|uniref:Uncharacterized protein n=1 Tax=Methylobacterium gnaphalii TaxID=1010610 RepID=A0A512JPC2_9HYPH|nr:hypothetical protein [Methylobacterium gnaphalii]GEP11801.1 hypothetical protein MGN01_36460 [Methylobacterium gnaphalii]GJD69478.1 hypothetical protein MMMDOFMJ_2409 [Methylobacterium gnaphalii]GLS49564.1 hypothetical protein GCM10007885_24130 [Methylobacterium gnaphalii]